VVGRELNLAMRWCKASPPYIYMVGFLGSLVLQAKEGLWGSKNVPQDEVEQNETSQKDYELRGFFIEL
jgi:hypothetical protein